MCSDRNELMQKKTREKMGFSSHRLLPKFTHVLFLLGFFLQASHSLLSESVAQVYQGCITRLSIHVDLFSLHALFP